MPEVSISVIIPAYNARDTILDAVRSVKDQTLSVDQIIVVDDGSTDDTAHLVESLNDSDVEVVRVPNGGPSVARNVGIGKARGTWLGFLDADDKWHPEKLKVQWQLVSADPQVGLVASDWIRGSDFVPVPQPAPVTRLDYQALLTMNQFQTSTVLMRHDVVDQLQGFDSDVDGAEDWDFWLRASAVTAIMKVDWPLVQYRDVPNGYSKNVYRVYSTMQPMLDKHRDQGTLDAGHFAEIESWHHLRFWVAFLLHHDRPHAQEAWRKAWQRSLRPHTIGAFTHYLIPFLWRRIRRRRT